MSYNDKKSYGLILAVALLAGIVGYLLAPNGGSNLGGATNLDDLTLSGALTANSATVSSITASTFVGGTLSMGGVSGNWISGSCTDATTTALAIANPISADAYVDQAIIDVTNGTTSITYDFGTSSNAYVAPSEALVDDLAIATSTRGITMNTSGSLSPVYGFSDPGTNSQDAILWKSGEYLNMAITDTSGIGGAPGVVGPTNTFSCTYKLHYITK